MLQKQIIGRGIKAPRVIKAFYEVDRADFVPTDLRGKAYEDHPLPIGFDQTISQPYMVAEMTELLKLEGGEKVLEIGTGSGYQTAILARIAKEVYTVELLPQLAESAKERLILLGYKNIYFRTGDGYQGWPEFAPYDRVIVTAAPEEIPDNLVKQLKIGSFMIIPVGKRYLAQTLCRVTRLETGFEVEELDYVAFVPMISIGEK